jgi:hypothetical protein
VPRGDANIFELSIDGASRAALHRINHHYRLGIPVRWWWTTGAFRELVRAGVRRRWAEADSVEEVRAFLEKCGGVLIRISGGQCLKQRVQIGKRPARLRCAMAVV